MKRQQYLALGRHGIILLRQLPRGSQLHEKKINLIEIIATFNSHMKTQHYLALDIQRFTLVGQLCREYQEHETKSI